MSRAVSNPKKKWKMPQWMKQYAQGFCNTGGNTIEELVNGNADPIVNLPLATLQFGAKCQVGILINLKKQGRLRDL